METEHISRIFAIAATAAITWKPKIVRVQTTRFQNFALLNKGHIHISGDCFARRFD